MSREDFKARVTGHIWQSIAQSSVPVSAIPKEQLDTLVSAIAEGVMGAMNEMLGDLSPKAQALAAPLAADEPERVLWKGRPLLSLVEHYTVTTQRVRITRGLFTRNRDDVELIRMQDLDYRQGLFGRILNRGTISISSSDASLPEARLRRVGSPERVHEVIRRAMLSARQRYRVIFQQEMLAGPGGEIR